MKNPIFNELIKLKLVSKLNLITLSNKTRDKKIRVKKDLKTKIIFLDKYITSNEYYSSLKYGDQDKKSKEQSKTKITNVQTFSRNIKTPIIEDDYRRAVQFKKYLKNKLKKNENNYKSHPSYPVCAFGRSSNFLRNNQKRICYRKNRSGEHDIGSEHQWRYPCGRL